jgi:diguanylate cyclase (GGDEF)-like protein
MGIQMNFDQLSLKNITVAAVIFSIILFISHKLLDIRTKEFLDNKYTNVAKEMQFTTQSYIEAKQESVLFIALSLANDPRFRNTIISLDDPDFSLDTFSKNLRLNTEYKNVWIQISDSRGISLYRSWTDKRGDDLTTVRKDIVEMIREPKIRSTISTGIFDMTFKSMVPIFKDEKFIGTIEVISKFNSISKQLLNNGYELVLLVDKSYRDQIQKPFTKMFIDDYYIANLDASEENRNYIQKYGVEKLIQNNNFYITDERYNRFITKYLQTDINGKSMGYFILFQPLDNIELEYIYFFHNSILVFISLLFIGIYLLLLLISSRHKKEKADLQNQLLSKEVEDKNIELEKQHTLLQNVINGIDQSVMVIDKEYNVLLANDAAREYSDQNIIQDPSQPKCYELTHHQSEPCSGDQHQCPLTETIEQNRSVQRVHRHTTPSGEEHFIELTTTPLYNQDNEPYAVVEMGHNITEHLRTQRILEEQKNELDYQAHYDALTSLPNRVLFLDRLEHAMQIAKRDNSKVALIFVDIDNFKEINDSIGHHAGDHILKECAKRLQGILREVDTVSRFGGDEFTIILERISTEDELVNIVQNLLRKLREPYFYEHKKLYSGASIGISIYPENGMTHQELLKNADAAMYKAKESGRNTYSFYTKSMTESAHERVMLETKLREAIKKDRFKVYYQPLMNLKTDKVIGYEALVRWIDFDGNTIYPNKFISIIEQTGLIVEIGKVILEKVFTQAFRWRQMDLPYEKIAINISPKQLKDPEFLPYIEELLQRTKCDPSWIEFEIIESFIIDDVVEAVKVLEHIKAIGISISLDDFGTGYSSLSHLKKLPISKLKIDKSFIDDIPDDENDKIITTTIINLAKDLNISVLAEGVETKEQEKFLLENGCYLVQGYLYEIPLTVDEINRRGLSNASNSSV